MLREYQLTNFKAFAGPETIPIRPITLIYGPNSSGKSSILQSLLLLKQTLEEARRSTPLLPKGTLVDLGDYREFIHCHDVSREFSVKALFTLDLENVELEWFRRVLKSTDSILVGLQVHFACNKGIKTAKVEIFAGDISSPLLSYAPGAQTVETNIKHDLWQTWWTAMKECIEEALESDVDYVFYKKKIEYEPFEDLRQDLENYSFEQAIKDLKEEDRSSFTSYQNFLPISPPYEFLKDLEQLRRKYDQSQGDYSPFGAEIFYSSSSERQPFRQGLDVFPLTFQVCSVFRELIKDVIYLGPLRSYPERYYTFSGNPSEQVGQYGELLPDVLFQNRAILKRVNAEFDRFRLGYGLGLSELKDENSDVSNVFALRIVDKGTGVSASVRDVGFGVSQVLPIIVQSLLSQGKTLLIEQPEIHLHPALQAELGDLFIQSALGEQQNTFLLETHSEHLILRIMRRMRETFHGNLPEGLPPVRPEDVAVVYVERDGSQSIVREMPLNERGELVKAWPGGFFEEGLREVLP